MTPSDVLRIATRPVRRARRVLATTDPDRSRLRLASTTIVTLIGVRANLASSFTPNAAAGTDVPNTVWLARTLFTGFLLPFEVAAVILTVAVVAAVMLTLRHRGGVRHQDPSWQSRVRASDRVRMFNQDVMDLYERVPGKTPLLVI